MKILKHNFYNGLTKGRKEGGDGKEGKEEEEGREKKTTLFDLTVS